MSVLLVVGIALIAAALWMVHLAFAGPPIGRVAKGRVAEYSQVEHRSVLTRAAEGLVGEVEYVLARRGWRPFTQAELDLAGLRITIPALVVVIGLFTATVFGLMAVLTNLVLGLVVAVFVPVIAKMWVRMKTAARRKAFADQLPQALQMMASSLRAGHGLVRSLDAVARDAPSPTSEELARVVNENRLGRDLVPALEDVSVRMASKDFYWVAGAIAAQRETGGNLNEILDQVAETIRERNHIRLQVNSLAAEGKLSAYILMALPVLIGFYYAAVSGDIMGEFVASTTGQLLLVGSGLLYVIGGFWMRSIVRIEF